MGLDPGVVGDRPVPHLLAALLTPTRAPHARLLKHWKGELSLRRWSDTRLLVASLALCCFFPPFAFPLLTLFSSERFFPLLSLLTFSPRTFSLSTFSPQTFSLHTFSLYTFSLFRIFLLRTSLSSQNVPLSLFPHFFYISERLSSQNVSPHRTYLTLSLARFYIAGLSPRVPSAQSSPRPTGARLP